MIDREIRCPKCNKKLLEGFEGWYLRIRCRCGNVVILDKDAAVPVS
mgnify:CR=1 FL=1